MAKQKFTWNDDQPIYRQITDVIIGRILDGTYPEGELLPSVRQCAEEFDVSPLTAAKVFQELDKQNITTKRRGIGSEVSPGSRDEMLESERKKFVQEEWPDVLKRMKTLGLSFNELNSISDDT